MAKDNKNLPPTGGDDVMFPLLFGIVVTILMAIISHFINS